MLPGLINQVSIDWDKTVNYYLATIKRYNGKLYAWLAPSGPNLGGAKVPGNPGTEVYWKSLDDIVATSTKPSDGGQGSTNNNWNNIVEDGNFFVKTVKNVSVNPPMNITASWWVKVSSCKENNIRHILQEARMHSTAANDANQGVAHVLTRCGDENGGRVTWSAWSYNYTMFAG